MSQIRKEVFLFSFFGLVCAGIEFLIFAFIIRFSSQSYLLANVISTSISLLINYAISRNYIFKKSKHSKLYEFFIFIFFSSVAILLNQFVVWINVEHLKTNPYVGKISAIGMVAVFNYLTRIYFIFRT